MGIGGAGKSGKKASEPNGEDSVPAFVYADAGGNKVRLRYRFEIYTYATVFEPVKGEKAQAAKG
jgi:hypothetical protein